MIILECDYCHTRRPARVEDFGTVPRCDICLISMSEVERMEPVSPLDVSNLLSKPIDLEAMLRSIVMAPLGGKQ